MNEEQILAQIESTLKNAIQKELLVKRVSRGFDGTVKPVSGKGSPSYNNRLYTGKLFRSTTIEFETDEETGELKLVLSFPNAPEWSVVNAGRRGKQQNPAFKYPPLQTILTWVNNRSGVGPYRNADGSIMSKKSQAFLIQRSIGEYGIAPTNFISEAFKKTESKLRRDIGEYAAEFFRTLIDRKIIIRGSNQ
jgi:hypothetical protein